MRNGLTSGSGCSKTGTAFNHFRVTLRSTRATLWPKERYFSRIELAISPNHGSKLSMWANFQELAASQLLGRSFRSICCDRLRRQRRWNPVCFAINLNSKFHHTFILAIRCVFHSATSASSDNSVSDEP